MMDNDTRLPKKGAPNHKRPKPTACFALLPEQVEHLRQIAEERQVSQSLLVRDALDCYFRQIGDEAIDKTAQARSGQRAEGGRLNSRHMRVATSD
ncbi:MAG TPA: CopG family transcriptional regulator [Thermomicrobiales bacterium]|nr:CopG family transcriptional regulator [Thermomicrobiales bacterium]